MSNQTNQHWQELQEPLRILNQRIAALMKDLACTLDGEQSIVLKERLKEAQANRAMIMAELEILETQPSVPSPTPSTKTQPISLPPTRTLTTPFSLQFNLIPAGPFFNG